MTCKKCGREFNEGTFCPNCGYNNAEQAQAPTPVVNDAPSFGYAVLCFFFPIVGLILYLVWKDKTPLRAKSCGKGALIGFIVGVVLNIINIFVLTPMIAQMGGTYGMLLL